MHSQSRGEESLEERIMHFISPKTSASVYKKLPNVSLFHCAEDKERYEKELEALPAEEKAKLSRKGAKKTKKSRSRAPVRPVQLPNS